MSLFILITFFDYISDSITLYIVNHGDVESVEVVEYKRGSTVLKHIKTILTGGRT